MRGKYRPHHILEVVLLFIALAGSSVSNSKANENSKYLDAVREFADNVLKYGRDTYGPKHTPLFVDGLNIHTHEPVKWIAPNGDRWILSNLASQQNLFRTLDGLTKITGHSKYRQGAMKAIEYAFEHLRSPDGLLYWGRATAFDVRGDEVFGWRRGGRYRHCLKANLPYYELMWQVNPEATKTFIESFWSAHILNWSNLDMNRWAHYGNIKEPLGRVWKHEYKGGPVFLESGSGGSFINTGADLIYAAAWLTKLSGEKEPLVWARRIAHRYVRTRHPKTGISYGMYRKPAWKVRESYDDVMKKLVPGTTEFLPSEFPSFHYTNPIAREAARGHLTPTPTPGISVHKGIFYWLPQFLVGEMLAGEGNEFKRWALEELTAFGKASYRKKDNVYVPILTDSTNLEGYVVKEDGPLGPKGVALESVPAGPSDFWAYTMGYRVTNDAFMWEMARNISKGNEFGDIGVTPKDKPELDFGTDCSDPYALLAFLELHRATGKNDFLKIAKKMGDNILTNRFHKGFFVASNKHIYTKFDAIDSLALLHLHSALVGEIAAIPQASPCMPRLTAPYRRKDIVTDNKIIYTLTESPEPPLSLQEAAAIGDIELVRSLLDKGVSVDSWDDPYKKTALLRAAISGHKDVVELLLAKGADIEAGKFHMGTALHYAAEKGHVETVELLIANGADVNAKNSAGYTPLHYAARIGRKDIAEMFIANEADINAKNASGDTPLHHAAANGYKDIVELLIANGADVNAKDKGGNTPGHVALRENHSAVLDLLITKGANLASIHLFAYQGDLDRVRSFIEKGADVNAMDSYGATSLHYAAVRGNKEVVEFLVARGAHVNVKDKDGYTPLYSAVHEGHRDVVELLITNDADVNVKDKDGWTSLDGAAYEGYKDVAELLITAGADVNSRYNLGETPLMWAAREGHIEVVKLLLNKGADVNAEDNLGLDSLQYAQKNGHTEIVELLRKHGAKEDKAPESAPKEEKPSDPNTVAQNYGHPHIMAGDGMQKS